ncbi:hypothetical protein GSI_09652 [Ganoderma sinense ZZ0214-1]|uniref:Nuclear condensin complex subunit 3 C-terminal domain-containing protein n=1 Tax=Ganoderma sinense ZZ0214-1 TaxID=1077348 RepID=A0A2G8S391_9APHY|nr:hypothetical protein GSI_09652 [Ganoderma sinense ZZ0214-1]
MPARNAAPFDLESLKTALPKIFDQVQNTTANHQKNFIALYKLHTEADKIQTPAQNGRSTKIVGEKAFWEAFDDLALRVVDVKKGNAVADRVIKFMAGYAKFAAEKDVDFRKANDMDQEEDTFTDRFLSHTIRLFLEGCTAKNKVVRMRVLQCIAEIITNIKSLEYCEDLYVDLRAALLDRLRDKEPTVRAYAVSALCALTEDPEDLEDDEPTILEMLVDTMTYDTAAEVRRAVITKLRASTPVLPDILARTRDTDATNRKLVYTHVLEKHCTGSSDDARVGFTHPRALTIAQRELIVRNGLGDREDSVRKAAAQLLAAWVDVVRADGSRLPKTEEQTKTEKSAETINDLVAFLNLFDLTEGTVAEDALGSVFDTRIDIFEHIEFSEDYWTDPTPERAFLARVFVDKCIAKDARVRLDETLPVTTHMMFRIQAVYNSLVEHIQADSSSKDEDEDAAAAREEVRLDLELTVAELLRLAVNLDYQDEMGRRKMFMLVQGMLAQEFLSEELLARPLDVLRVLSESEKDLIRVVVEVVHELRDVPEEEGEGEGVKAEAEVEDETTMDADETMTEMGESPRKGRKQKPVEQLTPEQKARRDTIDLRCLSLCIGMLERVNSTFEENEVLEGVLFDLIIPAVKRREMALRERGLTCLGLCCLIARKMASSSFQLFLQQVKSAPEVLKVRVLQIIFDILMVHEGVFLGPNSTNNEKIIVFLLSLFEGEESDKVQAVLAVGIAKLMLGGLVTDERVLQSLVLVFISPETVGNQELRQCLAYFFPAYSYSSVANQRRMQSVFPQLFDQVVKAFRNWEGEEGMVSPSQVATMLVDWTDPLKASEVMKGTRREPHKDPIHIDLAVDVVRAALAGEYDNKDEKKALCQMLGKLYLPDEAEDDKLRTLKLLVTSLRSRRPPRDTASKNAVIKFDNALSKKYEKQLENFSEDELRKLEELKELFEFLDDIIPLEDDEEDPPKKGRKRRSMSVATTTTTSATSGDRSPPPSPRVKSKAKRRRLSQSDDESDDDDARTETSRASPAATPVPTRSMPKRNAAEKGKSATKKAFQQPIVISSDEEEDEDDEDDDDEGEDEDKHAATPVAKSKARRAAPAEKSSSRARQEAQVDEDIDDMLEEGNVTKDSIMDSSEDEEDEADEEEEEVDNIL